jgi:hypothetical protein
MAVMAIGIIQIGLKRFYATAKPNHKKLYDTLNKRYGITVYDFYRDTVDPKCPFYQSGKVQVYDFLKAKNHVKEEVFIKVRSDAYFTRTSIDIICKEIDNVIAGESDIVFMGIDFMNDYAEIHKREDARTVHGHKVTDFVVVARKDKVADTDEIIDLLSHSVKDKSGNKTYNLILTHDAIAKKVSTQIYILRKEYSECDNWQIYWDWCSQYRKSPVAQDWVKNNADTIRSF